MAKRKRLNLPLESISSDLETKTKKLPASRARMPIAEVAGDTAGRAALEEVAREMTAAETEGRVIKRVPLEAIDHQHMSRDRLNFDPGEMRELRASIEARGQQTPIELIQLEEGRFGLISGLRRLVALKELEESHVLALIRRPEGAQASYVAMVEENEIRAQLSFYERANIAAAAAEAGVYPDVRAAVNGLFAHAAPAKRSKILKFVTIRAALHRKIRFPAAIPEKLGLNLAAAIDADRNVGMRIADALRKTPPRDAASERRVLERALKRPVAAKPTAKEIAPGVRIASRKGRAVLTGAGVDAAFLDELEVWAAAR